MDLIEKSSNQPKKIKELKADGKKGIETLFRNTSRNHIRLSAIADKKAHIMITVNAIIISLILAIVARKLDELPLLIYPTLMLLISNLLTLIFAVLAIKPKRVSKAAKIPKDGLYNLLNNEKFYQLEYITYEDKMKEILKNPESLYSLLIRDTYDQGINLSKKTNLLGIAYHIFLIGISISSLLLFLTIIISST
ncbi:hypothetical protein SAMN04488104_102458 [Algoriphagus faecimaris]|uniref:Pycsar effector protein domain-containing protein n=1 Tax=Algoriphagus faecimaris TaxID=686796 RepID=A0A1G6TVN0_9BACT|nr:Pycsar system effector family protein [Algoriphagus faecimaris]SDD33143.1 hypothetical protein SAMN04488104_102458 [Algoriphagus faecimaris]